jgi:hypothetical protein
VGAFTIPALPVAVIYAPPQDRLERNSAELTNTQSVGTTVSVSFSTATESTTKINTTIEKVHDLADVGEKVESAVHLNAESDELYGVTAYYDRLFGTFAYTRASADNGDMLVVEGTTSEASGNPAAGQLVRAQIDGHTIVIRAATQGRFRFPITSSKKDSFRLLTSGARLQSAPDLAPTPEQSLPLP